MELAIASSIAGTAKVVEPCQHRQQAVQVFETAQITLGEIGLLGCHRSPPANMTVTSCAESNAQISCRTGVECPGCGFARLRFCRYFQNGTRSVPATTQIHTLIQFAVGGVW